MTVRDSVTGRQERPAEPTWFVALDGQQKGPMSLGELRTLVREGRVDARSYAWAAGMEQWARAGAIEALAALFASPPPLPPPLPVQPPGSPRAVAPGPAAVPEARARPRADAQAVRASASSEGESQAVTDEAASNSLAFLLHQATLQAEAEARARLVAEAEAKARADAAAKAQAEAEAKARADAEAKARAEAEAKAQAEAEAKAQAEAEAKAQAEAEAKAQAEAEAKAQAEAEAKARADAAAKAQAEAEAKAQAEAEAKAQAEAKARADAEAKAQADALAAAPSQAPAAAQAETPAGEEPAGEEAKVPARAEAPAESQAPDPGQPPALERAPIDPPQPAVAQLEPRDLFDFQESNDDGDRPFGTAVQVQAELAALRQEFSIVARIERSQKKRWIWVGVGLAAAAALAIILTSGPEREQLIAQDVAPQRKPYEAVVRRALPPEPPPPAEAEPEPERPDIALVEPPKAEPKQPRKEVDPRSDKVTLLVPSPDPTKAIMTPERFAALTADDTGKSETRVVFDPGEAARKAAAELAAKKADAAGALSEDVALAFGKKKTQFAKCSDAVQERVKVVFTVTATGKTSNTRIEGTDSDTKARCIRAILDRSLFPAGTAELTYSQTLVL